MSSRSAASINKRKDFYEHPEKYYVKPFRIWANLWFVGNADVGAYLLDTEDGLVLIDTTYPTSQALMIQSIWEAGFDPGKIRHIFHTHGHFDHIGTTAFLKSLSGAKTYLGEGDAAMFREQPELMLAKEAGPAYIEVFTPDVVVMDGDVFQFGSTEIRCVATPGHTMGVLTFFIRLHENGEEKTAALCGGIGINTLSRDFIEEFHVGFYRELFVSSMHKIMFEHADIVLGNHTAQNDTLGKRERMLQDPEGPNPFIDPDEWTPFIRRALQNYENMVRDEENGTDRKD